MSHETPPSSRSAVSTIARAGTIALAIGVVAWLVWRAQRDAERVVNPAPADASTLFSSKFGQPVSEPTNPVEPPAILSSSKSLVIDDTNAANAETLMSSSKSGEPLPGQERGAFFDDGTPKPATLLPSSKSAVVPTPKRPAGGSPKR